MYALRLLATVHLRSCFRHFFCKITLSRFWYFFAIFLDKKEESPFFSLLQCMRCSFSPLCTYDHVSEYWTQLCHTQWQITQIIHCNCVKNTHNCFIILGSFTAIVQKYSQLCDNTRIFHCNCVKNSHNCMIILRSFIALHKKYSQLWDKSRIIHCNCVKNTHNCMIILGSFTAIV